MAVIYLKSPLKWAGGKHKLLERIYANIPNRTCDFYDVFAGSAVVAYNAPVDGQIYINDLNPDLSNFYLCLKQQGQQLIQHAQIYFDTRYASQQQYLRLRQIFNSIPFGMQRAILFLYLNKFGFNGMCRYNSSGKFNIPVGSIAKQGGVPNFPRKELYNLSIFLQKYDVRIAHEDFREVLARTGKGDIAYCDPPYWALSPTASFTAYAKNGFGIPDHADLRDAAEAAASRGAIVIVSNADTPETRELYKNASSLQPFQVRRSIGAASTSRKKVSELLAVYGI
jgi:DNA adenine methylase